MKYCSQGVSMVVFLRGFSMVIVWSMGPYSCRLYRMCCAYADCGFLYLIYRYVPGNGALGLGQFGLHMPVCRYCRSVCIRRIPLLLQYGVLLSVLGSMSWQILLLHLNAIFTLVCLSNIDEPTRCNNDLLIYKISYIFNTFLSILLRMRYVQKNLSRKSKFTFYS